MHVVARDSVEDAPPQRRADARDHRSDRGRPAPNPAHGMTARVHISAAKCALICRLQCAGWWSSSRHRKCLGEHRKIAVMSEAQFCEFIFLEPREGIVFVQREIDRSSLPTLD